MHQHQQLVALKHLSMDNKQQQQQHLQVSYGKCRESLSFNDHIECILLESTSNRQLFNQTNQLPPFTISEFKYSPMHIRLLHSVFDSIEADVRLWRR